MKQNGHSPSLWPEVFLQLTHQAAQKAVASLPPTPAKSISPQGSQKKAPQAAYNPLAGLSEFDTFGFVPHAQVLWVSRLLLAERPRSGKRLTTSLSLVTLDTSVATKQTCAALQEVLPERLSWFSSGLTFSADASRVAFVPANEDGDLSPPVACIASLRPHEVETPLVSTLPLGSPHGRLCLSPDGKLCVLERKQTTEVWNVFGYPACVRHLEQTDRWSREVILHRDERFTVVERDCLRGRLRLALFDASRSEAKASGGFWLSGRDWRVVARQSAGQFSLFEAVHDVVGAVRLAAIAPLSSRFAQMRGGSADDFPPVFSPFGRFLVWRKDDVSQNLCISHHDDTMFCWAPFIEFNGRQKMWRKAFFSDDELYLALLFDEVIAMPGHAPAACSGACIFSLATQSPKPTYVRFRQPIVNARLSSDGRAIAMLVQSVAAERSQDDLYDVHVCWLSADPSTSSVPQNDASTA